jgi:cytoskeleton protein RodZ
MNLPEGRLRVVPERAPEEGRDLASPPAADDPLPSPGRYLRDQRQRRGMSIDHLAAVTRIPRRSLDLLEADRHQDLPGPVFVRGFLRCCARAIKVDPETLLALLYDRERVAHAEPRAEWNGAPVGRRRPLKEAPKRQRGVSSSSFVLWLVVILAVTLLALGAFLLAGAGAQVMPEV